jgi:hypothetical protein
VREVSQFFIALLLVLFVPQRILKTMVTSQINKYYANQFTHVIYYKSGRSALAAIFQAALSESKEKVVLLPDYICNVVYLAAEHAGALITPYSTDELFCPNLVQIERLLRSMPVRVVLFASIFGTQNNRAMILQRVRVANPDVVVIFDESQNIVTNSSIQPDSNTITVMSFNDKTVPGVMGGALCLPRHSAINLQPPAQALFSRLLHELNILSILLKRVLRKTIEIFDSLIMQSDALSKYEFSHAIFEPYNMEVGPISKLSLLYAYFGLSRLSGVEIQRKYNARQIRKFFNSTDWLTFLDTEYADTAVYMPVKMINPDACKFIQLKSPYASHSNKNVSLRPDVFGILNDPDNRFHCLDA